MRMSNYGSFAAGVIIRGVPLIQTHPGKVFWVDNSSLGSGDDFKSGSDANKGTFNDPFSTLDYAIGKTRANKGDIIFIKPGHSETLTATSVAVDVAGIAIVGLGRGSNRPTFNATATGSVFPVSAANVLVHNLLFTGGVDAIVSMITVSAADVAISDVEVRDVTGEIVVGLLTTADANRLLVDGFTYDGAVGDGATAAIAIVGGDRVKIQNFNLDGDFSVAAIDIRTTATTRLSVRDGVFYNRDAAVDTVVKVTITASTGNIGPNLLINLEEHAANITEALTGVTFRYFGGGETAGLNGASILVCNLDGESAMTINKPQSTDA